MCLPEKVQEHADLHYPGLLDMYMIGSQPGRARAAGICDWPLAWALLVAPLV